MITNLPRTSTFTPSRYRRVFSSLLLFAALVAVLGAIASSRQAAEAASGRVAGPFQSSKIAPWVMEHTSNGQQAEFFVVLADQADLSAAANLQTKAEKGRFVFQTLFNKAQITQGPILQWLRERGLEHHSFYIVNAILVKGTRDVAEALAARPDVARVEGNPRIDNHLPKPDSYVDVPSSLQRPRRSNPGSITRMRRRYGRKGSPGRILSLPARTRAFAGPITLSSRITVAGTGKMPITITTGTIPFMTVSVTFAETIRRSRATTRLTARTPRARWSVMTDRVTRSGWRPAQSGSVAGTWTQTLARRLRYIECMQWFLAPTRINGTDPDPTKAPDITNNSWECPPSEGCSADTLQAAVESQAAAGIMMVSAAQNSGPSCSTVQNPPGIYEATYTAGALSTGTDTIAGFSSRGPVTADGSNRIKPDICAPGTGTRSSTNASDSSYANFSGTSMATPHIAGAMALLWSAIPSFDTSLPRAAMP